MRRVPNRLSEEEIRAIAVERYAGTLAAAGVRLAEQVLVKDFAEAQRTAERISETISMSIRDVVETHAKELITGRRKR